MGRRITDLPEPQDNQEQTIPSAYRLYGNYPNPFNPLTHIVFDLPQTEHASLVIYDILGHRIRELLSENLPAGKHTVTWDATDQRGIRVSSGIYFYILQLITSVARKGVSSRLARPLARRLPSSARARPV